MGEILKLTISEQFPHVADYHLLNGDTAPLR